MTQVFMPGAEPCRYGVCAHSRGVAEIASSTYAQAGQTRASECGTSQEGSRSSGAKDMAAPPAGAQRENEYGEDHREAPEFPNAKRLDLGTPRSRPQGGIRAADPRHRGSGSCNRQNSRRYGKLDPAD